MNDGPGSRAGATLQARQRMELRVGIRVHARYLATKNGAAGSNWYSGSVVAMNADGSCDVAYDDGEMERGIAKEFVQAHIKPALSQAPAAHQPLPSGLPSAGRAAFGLPAQDARYVLRWLQPSASLLQTNRGPVGLEEKGRTQAPQGGGRALPVGSQQQRGGQQRVAVSSDWHRR